MIFTCLKFEQSVAGRVVSTLCDAPHRVAHKVIHTDGGCLKSARRRPDRIVATMCIAVRAGANFCGP
jgi:hypothetical protein